RAERRQAPVPARAPKGRGLSGQIRSTTAKPRRTRRESRHLACEPIRSPTGGLAVQRPKSLQESRLFDRKDHVGTAPSLTMMATLAPARWVGNSAPDAPLSSGPRGLHRDGVSLCACASGSPP